MGGQGMGEGGGAGGGVRRIRVCFPPFALLVSH